MQKTRYMVLVPAYGRDYKNKKEILADFNENKDFVYTTYFGSTYINKEQIEPGTVLEFRYKSLRNVFMHKVEKKDTPL